MNIREGFRSKCQHVLEQLAEVYRVDAEAKERSLNPLERLAHHQTHSGPVMAEELAQKRTEPNSGLGKRPRLRVRQHARADKYGSCGVHHREASSRFLKSATVSFSNEASREGSS